MTIDLSKYLGLKHQYGTTDCITLVRNFYEQEFFIKINIPEYVHNRRWMKQFTIQDIDYWAKQCAKKVSLTEAKNYDLIIFKSGSYIIHFGIFIMPNRILHIEEAKTSCVECLSDYWITRIHGIYRHNELV